MVSMASNLKRSVDTPRRIARILCRALMCAAGLAVAATAANAQTSLPGMAYRADIVVTDCSADCTINVWHFVVTPWTTFWGYQPTWSPDRARVAFTDGYDIFVIPSTGGTRIQITDSYVPNYWFLAPAWSPDGGQIAFVRRRTDGPSELGVMNPDGSGKRALSNNVVWN